MLVVPQRASEGLREAQRGSNLQSLFLTHPRFLRSHFLALPLSPTTTLSHSRFLAFRTTQREQPCKNNLGRNSMQGRRCEDGAARTTTSSTTKTLTITTMTRVTYSDNNCDNDSNNNKKYNNYNNKRKCVIYSVIRVGIKLAARSRR